MLNILDELEKIKQAPSQYDIAVTILSMYNCRAGEVLSASWSNFFPDKFLILKGSKNSSNIIIRDRIILRHISKIPRINPERIFFALTYIKLYLHVKKYYSHLFVKFKTGKNYKVTHGFRYANVTKVNDEKFIRDILHHRSIRSGKYYKQNKES